MHDRRSSFDEKVADHVFFLFCLNINKNTVFPKRKLRKYLINKLQIKEKIKKNLKNGRRNYTIRL